MKTATITLTDIKDESWGELGFELGLTEDSIGDVFEYGEYGSITIHVDDNFNIIGGKVIPFNKLP